MGANAAPATDRRTVDELLHENEELARLGLFGVSGERAPSMLRAFKQVVHAGAALWTAASTRGFLGRAGPGPHGPPDGITWAIQLEHRYGLWPGNGAADERMLIVADNFTQAAHLVDETLGGGAHRSRSRAKGPGGRGAAAGRAHLVHRSTRAEGRSRPARSRHLDPAKASRSTTHST